MTTPLEQFIAKVRADEALRHKVFFAEAEAANALEALKRIAADEGFDLDASTPSAGAAPTPTSAELESSCGIVSATCCYTFTSTYIVEEALGQ
ncbi:hypothetical protein [Mycolicibacterium hodleri]|uniref:hypothetical protein n=1 Tax=Mycolicibacterium hodleri TaxID=49897 RepID=UPI001375C3E2|nr:hypothetical protein [Mycolicibacterium hodleri]